MKKKLLPCPFCGSGEIVIKPKRIHGMVVELNGEKFWRVECFLCDARTGDCFDKDAPLMGYKDGMEMAVAQWNRRSK